jgi:UTRA domain
VLVAGSSAGERLGPPPGSRVLVRRAVRSVRPADGGATAGGVTVPRADSLSDEYYPYELVRDTALASPGEASAFDVLAGIGHRLRGHHDEVRPRVATAAERAVLDLPQVSVVLELTRAGYDSDATPVVVVHQVRRGDGATYTYGVAYPGK